MSQSFKSSRVSIPGTICTNGFVWSYRAHATVGTTLEDSQSRAPIHLKSAAGRLHGGVIAAAHSLGSEVLARAIERTRTPTALARAIFQENAGTYVLGFLNLCRPQQAAGKPSFLCSRVQACKQARGSFTDSLEFAPAFLSVPVDHGNNHDSRSVGNGPEPLGEVRNVVR